MTADTVKHTSGPWKAVKAAHGPIDIFDQRGRDVVTVYGGGVEAESKSANANLIAAAPDLLTEAKRAAEIMERHIYPKPDVGPDHPYSVLQALQAVIARAEGIS